MAKKRFVTRKPYTDAWCIYDTLKRTWIKDENYTTIAFDKRSDALAKAKELEQTS